MSVASSVGGAVAAAATPMVLDRVFSDPPAELLPLDELRLQAIRKRELQDGLAAFPVVPVTLGVVGGLTLGFVFSEMLLSGPRSRRN